MTPQHRPLLVIAFAAALFSGCFSSSKTEYVDEPRMAVTFESPRAESVFNEAVVRNRPRILAAGNPQETTHVTTIVVNVRRQVITRGPNRDFNLAVQICDSDRNGVISEAEAEAFLSAGTPQPRPATTPMSRTTT